MRLRNTDTTRPNVDLPELLEQMRALEDRYQEWVKPINQATQEGIFKVGRNGYTSDDFERDVNQVREAQKARYDPYQAMYGLLDQLCPTYLDASEQQRVEIRAAASDKRGMLSVLLGYVYRSARRLRSTADEGWLGRGLAAASIEDCRRDARDTMLALAELYVAAEEIGLDPRSAFRAVSRLSSREKPPGATSSVSSMLAGFHAYAVLKERRNRGA